MGDNPSHDSDLEVSHEDQRFLRVAPIGVIMLVVSLGALAQDAESWATGPTFVSCRPTCVQTRKAFTNARVGALALLAVLVVLFTLPGCGGGAGTGGGPATAPPPPVAISLNQTAVTIAQGDQFTFVADVTGKTNTAVSWAIQEGSSGGSITSAGIYTAPATLGTFHVIATSQADNTRHATATVTVVTLELSVSPTSDVLGPQGVRVSALRLILPQTRMSPGACRRERRAAPLRPAVSTPLQKIRAHSTWLPPVFTIRPRMRQRA